MELYFNHLGKHICNVVKGNQKEGRGMEKKKGTTVISLPFPILPIFPSLPFFLPFIFIPLSPSTFLFPFPLFLNSLYFFPTLPFPSLPFIFLAFLSI